MTPKALILAAGRGERMRPLTDRTPKPLLAVHGRPLIAWHLEALARAGVRDVVINTAWLEEQFPAVLGNGERFGISIAYSMEGRDHGGALETAGGIAKALPLLGERFWVVSADIYAPAFRFDAEAVRAFDAGDDDALLWVVANPSFKRDGDFSLDGRGRLLRPAPAQERDVTYANIALVRSRLVRGVTPGARAPLGPLLFDSARAGRLAGRRLHDAWENVGTPAQLAALNEGCR
jgi:N-acetyl-alpha-D-muramate 1-phosphate uridylyltransferase